MIWYQLTMPRMPSIDILSRPPQTRQGSHIRHLLRRKTHHSRPIYQQPLVQPFPLALPVMLVPIPDVILHRPLQVLSKLRDDDTVVCLRDGYIDGGFPATAAEDDDAVFGALDHVVKVVMLKEDSQQDVRRRRNVASRALREHGRYKCAIQEREKE